MAKAATKVSSVLGLDFLSAPDRYPVKPIVVLLGDESFLIRESFSRIRNSVLAMEDAEFSLTSFEGPKVSWSEVKGELSIMTMFGGDQRLIRIEEADTGSKRGGARAEDSNQSNNESEKAPSESTSSFLGKYREELIDYIKAPSPTAILVLQIKTLPTTTLFYRALNDNVLVIDCRSVPTPKIAPWLVQWSQKVYHVPLETEAAQLMVERIGDELSLLEQELARLALLVPQKSAITLSLVSDKVGTWRTQKIWDLLDTTLLGKTKLALQYLEQLLVAGEEPIRILASFALTLRKMAAANRLFQSAQKTGDRVSVNHALREAGFTSWNADKAESQFNTLGRKRVDQLLEIVLQSDKELKGDSSLPTRVIIEKLIITLSHSAMR